MDKLRNRSGAAAPRAPGARPEPAAGGAERGSVTRTAAVPGGGKPGEGLVLMFGAPGDPREWVKVANSLLALVASGGLRAGDPLPEWQWRAARSSGLTSAAPVLGDRNWADTP